MRIKYFVVIASFLAVILVMTLIIPGLPKSEETFSDFGTSTDFNLINQNGEIVTSDDLIDKVVLMDFIYTRCSMPMMCLLASLNFVQVQQALGEKFGTEVILITITFDPGYDTPEVLKQYGESLGADFSGWQFLTGDNQKISEVMQGYGLWYEENVETGIINHTMLTVLIDREGNIRKQYLGNLAELYEILDDIQQLL